MKTFENRKTRRLLGMATIAVLLAAGPLPAQSDTTEIRPSDMRPMGVVEDPFERGKDVRVNVELWEQRVRAKLAQIEEMLKSPTVDLHKVQGQRMAKQMLLELLDDLDDEARAIIDAHGQVGPDLRRYRQALEEAPAVFRAIADAFDEKAGEDKDPFFKEGYADFAGAARKMAAGYETRAKGMDSVEQELAAKIAFVHKGRQFVADVRPFVEAIPTNYGEDTEKLMARINEYVAAFEEALKAIKGVANRLGEQPQPAAKPAKPITMSSREKDVPSAPLTVDQYRQQLAALKR